MIKNESKLHPSVAATVTSFHRHEKNRAVELNSENDRERTEKYKEIEGKKTFRNYICVCFTEHVTSLK